MHVGLISLPKTGQKFIHLGPISNDFVDPINQPPIHLYFEPSFVEILIVEIWKKWDG